MPRFIGVDYYEQDFTHLRELYTNASLTVPCYFQDPATSDNGPSTRLSLHDLQCELEEEDADELDLPLGFLSSDIDTNKSTWAVEKLTWDTTWKEFDDHFVEIVPSSNPESHSSFYDDDCFADSLADFFFVEDFQSESLDEFETDKWVLEEPINVSDATFGTLEASADSVQKQLEKIHQLSLDNSLLRDAGEKVSETQLFGTKDHELDVMILEDEKNNGNGLLPKEDHTTEEFLKEQDREGLQTKGEELLSPTILPRETQSPERLLVDDARSLCKQVHSPQLIADNQEKGLSSVCKVLQEECPVSGSLLESLQLSPDARPDVACFIGLNQTEPEKKLLEDLRLESPVESRSSASPLQLADKYKDSCVKLTEWSPAVFTSESPLLGRAENRMLTKRHQQAEHGFDDIQALKLQEPDIASDLIVDSTSLPKALEVAASQNVANSLGQLELNLQWSLSSEQPTMSLSAPEPLFWGKEETEMPRPVEESAFLRPETFEVIKSLELSETETLPQNNRSSCPPNERGGLEFSVMRNTQHWSTSASGTTQHLSKHEIESSFKSEPSQSAPHTDSSLFISFQDAYPRTGTRCSENITGEKAAPNCTAPRFADTPLPKPSKPMASSPRRTPATGASTSSKSVDVLDTPLVTSTAKATSYLDGDKLPEERTDDSACEQNTSEDQQCYEGFDLRFDEDEIIIDDEAFEEVAEEEFPDTSAQEEDIICVSNTENVSLDAGTVTRNAALDRGLPSPSQPSSRLPHSSSQDHNKYYHADTGKKPDAPCMTFDPLDNFLMLREVNSAKKWNEAVVKGHTVVRPVPPHSPTKVHQQAGVVTPMSTVPRSLKELQERQADQKLLTVALTGDFAKASELLASQADHHLQQLKKNGFVSPAITFSSLKPDVTRFMLKDRATKLTVINTEHSTDETYQALLLLHTLCSAQDLMRNCCLESAIIYLGAVQEKYTWLSGKLEVLRKELFRVQFVTERARKLHPKIAAVCREIQQHWITLRESQEQKDLRLHCLVIVRRDQPTLMKTLQSAIALDGTRTKIITGQDNTEIWPAEHDCLITWDQKTASKLLTGAHLVVEFEADRNSVLFHACQKSSVDYVGLCVGGEPMEKLGQEPAVRCEYLRKGDERDSQHMTVVGSQELIQHQDLLHLLETRHNIVVVARDYKTAGNVHHADVLVDAETGAVLLDAEHLQEVGALERVTERMASIGLHLSLVWILLLSFGCKNNGRNVCNTELVKKAVHLQALMANLSNASEGLSVTYKVIFCKTSCEVASYIRHLVAMKAERNGSSGNLDSILTHDMSQEEKCLLGIPCLNSVSAQLLLSKASVGQLMVMTKEELQALAPCLPATIIQNLHQVLNMDTGLRLLLDSSSTSDNSSCSHKENGTVVVLSSPSLDGSEGLSPQFCQDSRPQTKGQYLDTSLVEGSRRYSNMERPQFSQKANDIHEKMDLHVTACCHYERSSPVNRTSLSELPQQLKKDRHEYAHQDIYSRQTQSKQGAGAFQQASPRSRRNNLESRPQGPEVLEDSFTRQSFQYSAYPHPPCAASLSTQMSEGFRRDKWADKPYSAFQGQSFKSPDQQLDLKYKQTRKDVINCGESVGTFPSYDFDLSPVRTRDRPESQQFFMEDSSRKQLFDFGANLTNSRDETPLNRKHSHEHKDSETSFLDMISAKPPFSDIPVDKPDFPFNSRYRTAQDRTIGRSAKEIHHSARLHGNNSQSASYQQHSSISTFGSPDLQPGNYCPQEKGFDSSSHSYKPSGTLENNYTQTYYSQHHGQNHQLDYPSRQYGITDQSVHTETRGDHHKKPQPASWSQGIYGSFSDQLAATTRRLLQGQPSGFSGCSGAYRAPHRISIGLAQPLRRETSADTASQKPQKSSQEQQCEQTLGIYSEDVTDSPPLDTNWDNDTSEKGHVSAVKLRKWSKQLQSLASKREYLEDMDYPSSQKKRAVDARRLTYTPVSGAGGQTKLVFS